MRRSRHGFACGLASMLSGRPCACARRRNFSARSASCFLERSHVDTVSFPEGRKPLCRSTARTRGPCGARTRRGLYARGPCGDRPDLGKRARFGAPADPVRVFFDKATLIEIGSWVGRSNSPKRPRPPAAEWSRSCGSTGPMRVIARPPAGSKNRKLRRAWHGYLFDVRTGRSADGPGYRSALVVVVDPVTNEVTLNPGPTFRLAPCGSRAIPSRR
jgi:hypothetical protein